MITAVVDIGYYKKLHSENMRALGVGFRNFNKDQRKENSTKKKTGIDSRQIETR